MSVKERVLSIITNLKGGDVPKDRIVPEVQENTEENIETQSDKPKQHQQRGRGNFKTRTIAGRYEIPVDPNSDFVD